MHCMSASAYGIQEATVAPSAAETANEGKGMNENEPISVGYQYSMGKQDSVNCVDPWY